MKPNFALNISDTAIGLLRRTSHGWMAVGEAAFDHPNLDEAVGYLRASALGLSPHGITTKLVLPASQVLYTEVHAPGADKAAKRKAIEAALVGVTPYDVKDLVFDYWGNGDTVRVAVVARETLDEAEAFAKTHRLNPVSFVAAPDEGLFGGEPWFGQTELAAELLPAGEKVTRDQDPVRIISREAMQEVAAEEAAKRAAEQAAEKAKQDKAEAEAAEKAKLEKAEAEAAEKAKLDKAEAEAAEKAKQDKAEAEAAEKAKLEKAEAEATEKAKLDKAEAEATEKAKLEKAEAEAAEKAKLDKAEAEAAEKAKLEKAEAEAAEKAKLEKAEAEAAEKAETVKAAKTQLEAEAKAIFMADAEAKRIAAEAEKANAARAIAELQRKTAELAQARQGQSDSRSGGVGPAAKPNSPAPLPASQQAAPDDAENTATPQFSSRRREFGAAPTLGAALRPAPGNAPAPAMPAPATTPKAVSAPNPVSNPAANPAAPSIGANVQASIKSPEASPRPAPAVTPPKAATSTVIASEIDKIIAPRSAVQAAPPKASDSPARRLAAMVTAASIPGRKASSKTKRTPPAQALQTLAKPAKGAKSATATDPSFGKFGQNLNRTRGKPRFLGLFLVIALLAALAMVAAWSSYVVSRNQTQDQPTAVAAGQSDGALSPVPEAELLADQEPEALANADADADALSESASAAADRAAEARAAQTGTGLPAADNATNEPPFIGPQLANGAQSGTDQGPQDEIFLATMDGPPPSFDAVALPAPVTRPDQAPLAVMPPPPFGSVYQFDADGRILPTSEGVITPDGVRLIAARPSPEPPQRPAAISGPALVSAPASALASASAAQDVAEPAAPQAQLTAEANSEQGFAPASGLPDSRPKSRPAAIDTPPEATDDDAALTDASAIRLTSLRPKQRPPAVLTRAAEVRRLSEAASLAAAAVAKQDAEVTQDGSVLEVAYSPRPAARPRDFSRSVAAAVAAATRQPSAPANIAEPEEADEPEIKVSAKSAPRIPTHANVAKQATFKNAINLSKTNLIGVYGTAKNRYALIRNSSGRYSKVKVGDRVDGGTVAAITANEVRYKKGSKLLTLSMPNG